MLVSQSPSQALPKTKPSNECRASSWRGKVGARTECGREQDHFEPATVQEPNRRRGTPTHKQAREQASAGHSTFLIPAAFDHQFFSFPPESLPRWLAPEEQRPLSALNFRPSRRGDSQLFSIIRTLSFFSQSSLKTPGRTRL